MRRPFIVAIVVSLAVVSSGMRGGLSASREPGRPAANAPAAAPSALVGTWKLVSVERRSAKGELLPPATPPAFGSPNPIGLMMYDPDGYMGLAVMQSGRQKYAGSEPTPSEAKSSFESFMSFFGTYVVNEAAGSMTVHVDGSRDPNLTNSDYQSAFTLSGSRLTLKPRPTAAGNPVSR